MDPLFLVLRLLHIGGGILWVGATVFVTRYVQPTAKDLGPAAGPFMQGLTQTRKMSRFFMITGGSAVIAGTWLFLLDAGGDPMGYITEDRTGMAFAIGGIAAWAAFLIGFLATKPAIERMGAIGAQMRDAGGPPSTELVGHMQAAQARVHTLGQINLVLLGISVITMAVARYL
jgi:uncharacterized membrane protein